MAGDQKGAEEQDAWLMFLDESGFSLKPSVRRTWAPRGQTPVLRHRFNWQRVNAIGALFCRPDGSQCDLLFTLQTPSVNEDSVIGFLEQLRTERGGRRTVLLWDGLPAHRSRKVQAHLAEQKEWLTVERFPAYAPELNPVEYVWSSGSSLKGKHVAGLCADAVGDLSEAVEKGAKAVGDDENVLRGCLAASTLYQPNQTVTPLCEGQ